jgi:hypothetical protein
MVQSPTSQVPPGPQAAMMPPQSMQKETLRQIKPSSHTEASLQ